MNQLTGIAFGDAINKTYTYTAGQDNGQITQASDQVSGESILYSYDSLKRLSAATASAVPKVANHSFEQASPSSWNVYPTNFQVTDQTAHSGLYSLRFLSGGGGGVNTTSATQSFSCSAGTTYTFTGWHKEDPSQIGSFSVTAGSFTYSALLQNATQWTQFTYAFKPTNCAGASIAVSRSQTLSAGGRCGWTICP